MKWGELTALCLATIGQFEEDGNPEEPFVRLVLTRERAPTGRTIQLCENQGPRGRIDIIRTMAGYHEIVTLFSARKILKWVAKIPGDCSKLA